MISKKGFRKNFAKFTGKHLCQSLFFTSACSFIKIETLASELYEICKNAFSYRTPPVGAPVGRVFT